MKRTWTGMRQVTWQHTSHHVTCSTDRTKSKTTWIKHLPRQRKGRTVNWWRQDLCPKAHQLSIVTFSFDSTTFLTSRWGNTWRHSHTRLTYELPEYKINNAGHKLTSARSETDQCTGWNNFKPELMFELTFLTKWMFTNRRRMWRNSSGNKPTDISVSKYFWYLAAWKIMTLHCRFIQRIGLQTVKITANMLH